MMKRFLAALRSDQTAASAVEFALIGPAFLTMFLGVMQIGMGMQNYNALRSISADTARWAVVNYQNSDKKTGIQMQNYAISIATKAPYGLSKNDFEPLAKSLVLQRVNGAKEFEFTLKYNVPTFLAIIGIDKIPISYTRPIFVLP